jgi:hypothetical protein
MRKQPAVIALAALVALVAFAAACGGGLERTTAASAAPADDPRAEDAGSDAPPVIRFADGGGPAPLDASSGTTTSDPRCPPTKPSGLGVPCAFDPADSLVCMYDLPWAGASVCHFDCSCSAPNGGGWACIEGVCRP